MMILQILLFYDESHVGQRSMAGDISPVAMFLKKMQFLPPKILGLEFRPPLQTANAQMKWC